MCHISKLTNPTPPSFSPSGSELSFAVCHVCKLTSTFLHFPTMQFVSCAVCVALVTLWPVLFSRVIMWYVALWVNEYPLKNSLCSHLVIFGIMVFLKHIHISIMVLHPPKWFVLSLAFEYLFACQILGTSFLTFPPLQALVHDFLCVMLLCSFLTVHRAGYIVYLLL